LDIVERARREVEELHAFFGRWYSAPQAAHLERVSSVLAPEFELLSPSGELLTREQILNELAAHRGAFPDLSISVEGLEFFPAREHEISARYTEVHSEAGKCEKRRCCALLRHSALALNGLEWVAIGERHDV
jgi:hypothetical protein